MVKLPEDAPSPRLCCVKKNYDSQEYGFNLHAEKGKGQFIGAVDSGSIAEQAGLKPGDRIFAVNGFNIQGVSHKEVVAKIKSNPLQCELLVISEDGAKWYDDHDIPIDVNLPNIIRPCKEGLDDFANYPGVSMSSPSSLSPAYHQQPSISETKAQLKLNNQRAAAKVPNGNVVVPPPRAYMKADQKRETKVPISTDKTMNPRPRLCNLVKQSPIDEYGFNLHVEKGKGHFIGAVDNGGIADKAGLEMGQRIVGVNGELVYPHTPHKDVVGLIKRDPLSTELLVASEEVDRWHTDNAVPYNFENAIVYNRPRGQSKVSVNNIPNGSLPQSRKDTMESHQESDRLKTITNTQIDESYVSELTKTDNTVHLDNHAYSYLNEPAPAPPAPAPLSDDLLDQIFSNIPLAPLNYTQDAPQQPLEIEKPQEPEPEPVLEEHAEELHIHEEPVVYEAKEEEIHEVHEEVHATTNGHHSPASSRTASPKPAPTLYIPPPPPEPPVAARRTASPAFSDSTRSNGSSEAQNKPPSHDQAKDIFKLNAKEARQLLVQKKKDPRRQNMSLEQKHDIILNL